VLVTVALCRRRVQAVSLPLPAVAEAASPGARQGVSGPRRRDGRRTSSVALRARRSGVPRRSRSRNYATEAFALGQWPRNDATSRRCKDSAEKSISRADSRVDDLVVSLSRRATAIRHAIWNLVLIAMYGDPVSWEQAW